MNPKTKELWDRQNSHDGDRKRLFTAVAAAVDGSSVLYPGSYVDVAASFAYENVTYVDVDRRAAAFFADVDGVNEIIAANGGQARAVYQFIHADYTTTLGLKSETFDVLVSLYAGFVSEACTDLLRIGGTLLVAPSHGDAALAAIDPRYELSGVVTSRSGDYRVGTRELDTYLIPKKPIDITREYLHAHGRGVPYTKSAFAYLFTRTS